MTAAGTVSAICVAPVKGLGLVRPAVVDVTVTGLAGDRRYAMVDTEGRLVNGKKQGPLVRVQPLADDGLGTLVLRLPDGTEVGGPVELGDPVEAVFYGEPRETRLVLGPYADALSALAGQPLRLVRLPDGEGIDRRGDGVVTLQSQSALEAMATAAGLDEPVDGRRFRMTFTVTGVEAHAEDSWLGRRVQVGDAVVRPAGNVGRCAITTHDPDTGVKSLDTLALLQRTRGALPTTEPLPFGVHAEVLVPGRVALGDAVVPLD